MASSLAEMLATVELLTANRLALVLFSATWYCSEVLSTETRDLLLQLTRRTVSFVAGLGTLVLLTREQLTTSLVAGELSSLGIGTGDSLLLFATVAGDGDFDEARRTAARVAEQVTRSMAAPVVLLLFAVLSTRVRNHHVAVRRLLILATVALVSGQGVLCVAVVAVRTSPVVESGHELGCFARLSLLTGLGSFIQLSLLNLSVGMLLWLIITVLVVIFL